MSAESIPAPERELEWRVIPGFPDYIISEFGTVMRTTADQLGRNKGRIMAIKPDRTGYLVVSITDPDLVQHRVSINRLVATAFVGEAPGPWPYFHAAHLDGVKANNHYSNLQWKTPKANNADKLLHGTSVFGSRVNTAKLTRQQAAEIKNMVFPASKAGIRVKKGFLLSLREKYGISYSSIYMIRQGKTWKELA
jgi:hypothetical protein